jgi:adenylate cyclase
LQGRFFSNKRTLQDLQKAIEYFQQAIALDPNYALAFAGLSEAYSQLSTNGAASHDLMMKSKEAALKALSLDERLAEGHSALGAVLHGYDFDFAGAEREFKRALELNSNYSAVHHQYGRLLSSLGRHEEAIAELKRALEIDPLSLPVNRIYGEILLFARKYDESIAQFKKTIELDPNFPQSYLGLATAYQIKGMHSEAVEMYVKMLDINGNIEMATSMRESFAKGGWQGFLRVLTGERRLSTLSPTYLASVCYVELGEKDKAFAELDKAYESREFRLILLKVDPRLDPLRDDARFKELLRKVGFPP